MMNTATVGMAVTPVVVSTFFSHYLHRKPLRHKPTAALSYHEGLRLIREFLLFASRHTVEELQAFTSQWVPHPQWVKVDEIEIPEDKLSRAASLLQEQLGPDGIKKVGGKQWWQWRKPDQPLKAEWIEMKADYYERKKNVDPGNRVMLYVHGGAYFFGSVDEHRYQIQRHARKLKARALAPRYRLAPQFPFPCGLHDCLATYLELLADQEPSTIILAGDSAGAGMVLSMLVVCRDRGIPLPASAVLVSPWVDLTHSFPSVSGDCPYDYIPPSGFHHKPSRAWPPPNEEQLEQVKHIATKQKQNMAANGEGGTGDSSSGVPTIGDVAEKTTCLKLAVDGQEIEIREQIQMYTTNELLAHPLVSPVMQPTLGGLCPLLIMVGGGEMLRDEQIYLAHKCAHPSKYRPAEALLDDTARAQIEHYKPTDVVLQVWDDLCHVAPTLSFTRPAKYMYRSVAQFGAWALARAQNTGIDILDDDDVSVISSSRSSSDEDESQPKEGKQEKKERRKLHKANPEQKRAEEGVIGRAGDPLPHFHDHMIRQRVSPNGDIFPLPPAEELPGCCMERDLVGVIKVGPVRKWLERKKEWENRFHRAHERVHKQRLQDMAVGYEVFPEGDVPPPSALAGRRKIGASEFEKRKEKSMGLALWSLWGSKHDKMTMDREKEADKAPETRTASSAHGQGARHFSDLQNQEQRESSSRAADLTKPPISRNRSSHRRLVRDESQTGESGSTDAKKDTPLDTLLALRREGEGEEPSQSSEMLSPLTGATGKRPIIDGISMPFTLGKEADTASMMTLTSMMDQNQDPARLPTPNPASPHPPTPGSWSFFDRPGMERFFTAEESLPN
ncbi:monoterpene epsilon-lactone hydrolase [Diplogelasinospora grovesii]|uniref:Monoterpene epsilon-lactone hydrolase n=1 Tax=Diplogelasinospora grovesii TaxID=303347 RepID=A0AAN6S6G8_9PEZI|nr:monoterpene epsilon-lactone hydrolase [Diplogelasinospora grovesii]